VLVTHDRALADNFADRTVLISQQGVFSTVGGVSTARVLEESSFDSRRARAREIGRKIEQLQADVRAKAGWSAVSEKRKIGGGLSRPYYGKLSKKMAARAKAVQRRVDREIEELVRTKPFVPKKLSLSFPKYKVAHRDVFHLREVDFAYPPGISTTRGKQDRRVIRKLTFSATTRDRYCLMGKNGSGKTTIVKLIEGALAPVAGTVSTNTGIRMASIPQKLDAFFARPILLDNFQDCGLNESAIRQHLGSVMIRKDKVSEPIENFSRGELMRAAVAKCILLRAEFLLLDEPTSNLDIESIEVLEKILNDFQGGFLVITHDRQFATNVADELYMVEHAGLCLI
jgi:ATP-binding cassette subfamily F protein 3